MKRKHQGFSLVEILIAITIIAVLCMAGVACVNVAKRKARCAVEINAARNLIAGYLSHASDNNGTVLAGYQTDESATNLEGEPLHHPVNARYPWRLTPSLPKIEGVMMFNGNEQALKEQNRDYLVSVRPNLGLNDVLVGGHFGTGSPLPPTPKLQEAFGKFWLSRLAESSSPEKLIVFASARHNQKEAGYFEVRPPKLNRQVWSSGRFSPEKSAESFGFVDMRWSGKAVCAMLGGNVELLDESKLRDMRRWSIQAQEANDRDFLIKSP
jgi:prepilin-type N-terminal cleavage/methylation domain-containing protein